MTRVPWEALPGQLIEDLVAALLLLSRPRGNQITPSRGDRGIDLRETVVGGERITQIKRYTGPLTARQKREIVTSWQTFLREGIESIAEVESWVLALPCNPTPETKLSFEDFSAGSDFPAHWMGRTQLDTLAAARPDIVDYFLGNGADEVKRLMAEAVRGGTATDDEEAGPQLLSAVIDRQLHLAAALGSVDPFYSYHVEVRPGPMPTEDAPTQDAERETDFVSYRQVHSQTRIVTRIRPTSPHSTWLRPITQTVRFDVIPGTFEIEVAGSDMPLGTIPGAMFRNPMVIALDNESYVLDRTELIYFRQRQIDPLVPNVAVRAGDTVRLTPHEPAAVLAVPHSFKPGDNLPQLADS